MPRYQSWAQWLGPSGSGPARRAGRACVGRVATQSPSPLALPSAPASSAVLAHHESQPGRGGNMSRACSYCILLSCPSPYPGQKGQEGCWGRKGRAGSAASGLQQWGLLNAEEPQNQGLPLLEPPTAGPALVSGSWTSAGPIQCRSLSCLPSLPGSGGGGPCQVLSFSYSKGHLEPEVPAWPGKGDSVSPSAPGQ